MKYIISCLTTNFAKFSGRARRKEYWLFQLFNIPLAILIAMLSNFANFLDIDPILSYLLDIFPMLLALVLLIPSFAVAVRRLHDINRSGGWVLLSAPIYLKELLTVMHWPGQSIITVVSAISSIALIIMMIIPGNVGENQYGPDPKALDTERDKYRSQNKQI